MRKPKRGVVSLPKGVHHVVARGKDYFYWQPGRGTKFQGPRVALPKDVHSPEFWIELRKAQGDPAGPAITTINAVCDLYVTSPQFAGIAHSSQSQYRLHLRRAREAWGVLPASGLRPRHVRELLDTLAHIPGAANTLLGVLRALSKWGLERGHFDQSITEGVKPYKVEEGHKPWTAEQRQAAERHFTGLVRRAYFLALYTGQRGSDIIRLSPTDIEDAGFRVKPRKTGKKIGEIWCPIDPPLAAEMATWERRPGPFVPMVKKTFEDNFARQRDQVPELEGATFHGLRGTRVVELRERGHNTLEISAQVGMSAPMIERYCRFADKKRLGQAAVLNLAQARKEKR